MEIANVHRLRLYRRKEATPLEIADVHRLRLYRRKDKEATPFEIIDGCDIILPQSRHSFFQLQGGHHADFSKNTSTKYLWRKLKNTILAVSALTLTASLERRVNITSSCSGLIFGEVKSVTLYMSISEGDSHYQAGDFNQAIISYTAAIRKILNNDGDHDTALLAHFRSLSQRSEAYLALSNFEQAHTDARNALDLYHNWILFLRWAPSWRIGSSYRSKEAYNASRFITPCSRQFCICGRTFVA
jgi:tetratricopeptide (TPR) repeat protein